MQGEWPITHWIAQRKGGNATAAEPMCQAYLASISPLGGSRPSRVVSRGVEEGGWVK
jgi:hypothetical protein